MIKVGLHFDKGNQFQWKRWVGDSIPFTCAEKEKLPKLGLWTNPNFKFICADFDKLPSQFYSWDSFYSYMNQVYNKQGLVIRSASNKVKILFKIESKFMTKEKALASLAKILDPDHMAWIDTSVPALSLTFVNQTMYMLIIKHKFPTHAEVLSDTAQRGYSFLCALLPKDFEELALTKSESSVLRVLCALPRLLTGYQLPITKIAATVGVTHQTVSRALKKLVALGLLEVLNNSYVANKQAKTYKAKARLREFLFKVTGQCKLSLPTVGSISLPTAIRDGHWYETLWRISSLFKGKLDLFQLWAESIRGSERKDRVKLIKQVISSRMLYDFTSKERRR